MHVIQQLASADPNGTSVFFLTPCHTTPYYTHVHRPIPMRFLDCSPPLHTAATASLNQHGEAWLALPDACPLTSGSMSQRQCFESDPAAYLDDVLTSLPPPSRPRLVVGYAPLMRDLTHMLAGWGYHLHTSLTNCWVQTDPDSPCELQLWSM